MTSSILATVCRRSALGIVLGSAALVGPACSGTSDDPGEDVTSSAASAITADDIMTRAAHYIASNVLYCQAPPGQVYDGPESCYGETACPAPKGNPWDDYRTDCSGFVSYVWQIPSDPDTATFSYDMEGTQGWSTVPIDSMRAGDAFVTEGHIKLFSKFEGEAAEIYEEFDCYQLARKTVQAFERHGSKIKFVGNDDRLYHAIRRNALTPPPKPPPPPPPGKPTPKPVPPTGCGEIQAGHGLAPGRAIRSCDSRFELVLQGDGNLVEYGPVLGAMWTSGTGRSDGYAANLQSDGNFVLFGKTSNVLWESHSNGNAGAVLKLQDDGNIVVYSKAGKALWTTHTEYAGGVAKATGCGMIKSGTGLVAGESIGSCEKNTTLAMQTDGNLVMYEGGKALWSSNTRGKGGYKVQVQGDGNFVLYDWHNKPIWSAGTSGHPGSFVGVQGDGNLVVYAPGPHAIWASNTAH